MIWTKIEQEMNYLEWSEYNKKIGGAVYKDHLVVLEGSLSSGINKLCFHNLCNDFFLLL